ncbi:MAG: hypothetical protein ACT4PE_11495, partial [Candidatus Eiseniibacteriota bacterium]
MNCAVTYLERPLRFATISWSRPPAALAAGLGPIADIDRTEGLLAIRVERQMGFWLEQSEGYAELLMRLATEDAAREAFVDVVDNGQQDLFTTEAALVDQTA